jgi:hypothetical protein
MGLCKPDDFRTVVYKLPSAGLLNILVRGFQGSPPFSDSSGTSMPIRFIRVHIHEPINNPDIHPALSRSYWNQSIFWKSSPLAPQTGQIAGASFSAVKPQIGHT